MTACDWLSVLERRETLEEEEDSFEEIPRDFETKVANAEVYATTPEFGVEEVGRYPREDLADLVSLGRSAGVGAEGSRQKSKLEVLPADRARSPVLLEGSRMESGGDGKP